MKFLIIFIAFIGAISSRPDGYFKQHYQFKQSSATYKNNELQTKNDDEGFYSKHGDLEGRVAPKVDQHNEHREFVNPHVDGVGHSVTRYDDRDLTDEAESVFSKHQLGVANGGGAHHKTYAYESSYSTAGAQNNYQPSSYGTRSNLGSITQNLQYDLSQQLQEAISKAQSSSSYRSQSFSTDEIRILEDELKANLTRQLQDALRERYGNQGKQGSYSYTITTTGGFNPQANYDNRELTDLTKQVEDSLIKQLHEKVQHQTQTYHQESSYGRTNHRDSAEVEDLNRQYSQPTTQRKTYTPYQTTQFNENSEGSYHTSNQRQAHYKPIYTTEIQEPTEKISYASAVNSNQHRTNFYNPPDNAYQTTYSQNYPVLSTPQQRVPHRVVVTQPQRIVINPQISITDVAQNVQNDLSERVNHALESFEQKYSSSSYSLTGTRPDYQTALDDFKRDLKNNMTILLQDELNRKYGSQIQRGEYLFSSGSTSNANYRVSDLDELKRQMEENLVKHLENSFRQQENRYISQSSSSSYYSSGRNYNQHAPTYTSALTDENAPNTGYVNYRPTTNSQSSHTSYSSSYNSGIKQNPTTSNVQLEQIRNQLEEDMRQQLTAAIQKQKSGHSNYQTQIVVQDLTDELKQNLTQKLEETLRERYGQQGVRGGYSYTVSASGSLQPKANYNSADLNALTQQLQDDLVRQLQQQVNQQQSSYSQSQYSSSYNPSAYTSGGTGRTYSYTPTHNNMQGFQKYNQFSSSSSYGHNNQEVLGEDCTQDAHTQYKRDLGSHYYSDSHDHYYHPSNQHHYGYHSKPTQYAGQVDLDDELTEQTEDIVPPITNQQHASSYHHQTNQYEEQVGQQLVDLDDGLTQQIEDVIAHATSHHHHQHSGSYHHQHTGSYHNQHSGSYHNQHTGSYHHKPSQYDEQVGQQVEDHGIPPVSNHYNSYGHHYQHSGSYHHKPTQSEEQTESHVIPPVYNHYGRHQPSYQQKPNQNEEEGGQHIVDDEQTNWQGIPPEHKPKHTGQSQTGNLDTHTSKPKLTNVNEQPAICLDGISQKPEDVGQQPEDAFDNLQLDKLHKQIADLGHQVEDLNGLAQQTEDDFGKLELSSQNANPQLELGQQTVDLDGLSQKTEDDFGVQPGSYSNAHSSISNSQEDFGRLEVGSQKNGLSQQTEDLDGLSQKTEDLAGLSQQTEDGFGQTGLHSGSYSNQHTGQQTEDLDGLSQQTEDDLSLLKPQTGLQSGSYSNQHLDQQVDDGFSNLEVASHVQDLGQQTLDLDGLSQKTEDDFSLSKPVHSGSYSNQQVDDGFSNLEVGSHVQDLGQQTLDLDGLSQKTEDDFGQQSNLHFNKQSNSQEDFGKLEVGSQKPININGLSQQIEDLDGLSQQTEDDFSNSNTQTGLHSFNHYAGQQVEDGFGNLEVGSHVQDLGQQTVDLDELSQKTDDLELQSSTKPQINKQFNSQEDFGKLKLTSLPTEDLDELSQKTEDEFTTHFGLQTSTVHPIIDLSQQFEDLNNTTTHDNIEVNHSKPTDTHGMGSASLKFNQQDLDDLFDMTQQIEDINKHRNTNINQNENLDYSQKPHGYYTNQNHGYRTQQPQNPGYTQIDQDDLQDIHNANTQMLDNIHDITQQHEDDYYTSQHSEDALSLSDVQDQIINEPVHANAPIYLQHATMKPYSSQQHSYQSSGRTIQYGASSYRHQPVYDESSTINYKPEGIPQTQYHLSQHTEDNEEPLKPYSSYQTSRRTVQYGPSSYNYKPVYSNIESVPQSQYHLSQHTEDEVTQHQYNLDSHPSYALQHHLSQQTEDDEPLAVPNSQRNLPLTQYELEHLHSTHQVEDEEHSAINSKVPQTNYGLEGHGRRLDSTDHTETVTTTNGESTVPTEAPTFWKKVGGKISNSFSAAKQKAKDIADKLG